MMNEAKKKKVLLALVGIAIAVVFFFAGFGAGYGAGKGADDAPAPQAAEEVGGMTIGADGGMEGGVSLTATKIARTDYDEYEIMPIAETAYTVTATVTGDSLTDTQKSVIWGEVKFKDPSSAWATGKNASDYVKTSPSGNQLTVSCVKAFGEQIIITCTSAFNLSVSKDLTVDYMDKPTIAGVTFTPYYASGDVRPSDPEGPITDTVLFKTTGGRKVKCFFKLGHSSAYTLPYEGKDITGELHVRISEDLSYDFLYDAVDVLSSPLFTYDIVKSRFVTFRLSGVTVTSTGVTSSGSGVTAEKDVIPYFFDSEAYKAIFQTTSSRWKSTDLLKLLGFVCEGTHDLYYEVVFVQADGTETVISDALYVDLTEIIEMDQSSPVSGIGFGEYDDGVVFNQE